MAVTRKQGSFSWNELLTRDVEASKAFYTQLFGWTAEASPGGEYTIFKVGDEQIAGMSQLPGQAEQAGSPSHWGAYVTVDNLDDIVEKAQALGATVLRPPTEISVGRFCLIQDPQGAIISFVEYTEKQG